MVAAENYALSNECVPNNEVLRIFVYHTAIRGKHVNIQRERECQGDVAHGNTRSRAQLGRTSFVATTCTKVYLCSLPR